ncbi:MAG: hypothetical protein K0S29_1024 [Gammaproteobacteria bacterium]|jgi:hypothetical protein|nr:hypothetical protein [Gammaproteobacteria bacterium]
MSKVQSQHSSLLEIAKAAHEAVYNEFSQANKATEYYQQQKHSLWTMRAEAEEQIRELKLQFENTINQLRQHIAKIEREYRTESHQLRKLWVEQVLKI